MKISKQSVKLFLASGFFLGLLPFVPGSFGALVGVILQFIIVGLCASKFIITLYCLLWVLLFSYIHYKLTPWAQSYWHDSDPSHFVIDEIVGYLCVPVFTFGCFSSWQWIVLGFVLFRILDAIKLPGARYIDRNIHTATGVLFDDVVSAAYTALFLFLIQYCFV